LIALATHSRAMQNTDAIRAPFERKIAWIFDLDNTLYPAACDLFSQIDQRMTAFIARRLGIDPVAARALQKRYYHQHGTTLAGLMANEGVPPDAFLDYVHDIDVTPVPPSPALGAALARLPGRRFVYTNGSRRHAENVMDRLGVTALFDGIYDITAAGYRPKPAPEPYGDLVEIFDIAPERAVMVEDMPRNLAPAHAMGMTTVWIRTDRHPDEDGSDDHIHHVADDLLSWLHEILPEE